MVNTINGLEQVRVVDLSPIIARERRGVVDMVGDVVGVVVIVTDVVGATADVAMDWMWISSEVVVVRLPA